MKTLVNEEGALSNYKIFETNSFLQDIEELNPNRKNKIYLKIQNYIYPQLKINPFYGKNIKKLINYKPPTWRYRVGDYRLFYEINNKEKIVFIIGIEIRHKAY